MINKNSLIGGSIFIIVLFFSLLYIFPSKLITQTNNNKSSKIDVHTIIRTRRSIRSFKQTPINLEILKQIVRDGTLAPSADNLQPWEFIIVTEKENLYLKISTG